jgi:tetratricopeptide (TPR) repeat protein
MSKPLENCRVAFTGKLASMSRREAARVVEAAGGTAVPDVTQRTSLLIVGMEGWPLLPDGTISRSLQRAEELQGRGSNIEIVPESEFLERVGLRERRVELQKAYTTEEVCRLLGLEPETLRRWELFELVRSSEGRYDFQDLVSLRAVSRLLAQGVNLETIAKSLQKLSRLLPEVERPLAQLRIVADKPEALLVDLGETRLTSTGQVSMGFPSGPDSEGDLMRLLPETASEWFEWAQTCEEDEDFYGAVEAYRKAINLQREYPEAYFNLGNVLRELGAPEAAEARYKAAVAQDPEFAAAHYNLADIQEEQGRLEEAKASLQAALEADPNFADAHYNLALCYERLGKPEEARRHWSAYLDIDPNSEWADVAREHLSKTPAD